MCKQAVEFTPAARNNLDRQAVYIRNLLIWHSVHAASRPSIAAADLPLLAACRRMATSELGRWEAYPDYTATLRCCHSDSAVDASQLHMCVRCIEVEGEATHAGIGQAHHMRGIGTATGSVLPYLQGGCAGS
jgi:hypothetical protein